jgi:Mrp family chromosome partitioning ATPase
LELLKSGKLSALTDQLKAWFDWIIVDSPPVLPLADTSVWMRLADGILLIARQGIVEKQQLQTSDRSTANGHTPSGCLTASGRVCLY